MNIFRTLLLLFIAVPIIEIYLLIKVGSVIGAGATILAIIGTAILGAFLLKSQGISTLNRVQSTLQQGQVPAIEMMEGLILLICGALLLTPGFFTDALGFLALIPAVRQSFVIWALKHSNVIQTNSFVSRKNDKSQSSHYHKHENVIIEGEYKKEDKP